MATTVEEIKARLVEIPDEGRLAYCERLAIDMTVMNRAIWSDENLTLEQQLNGLKWSNEFLHRLWGIIWELRRDKNEAFDRLIPHVEFHVEQAPELSSLLPGAMRICLDHFAAAGTAD